jgi:hypothetical protein
MFCNSLGYRGVIVYPISGYADNLHDQNTAAMSFGSVAARAFLSPQRSMVMKRIAAQSRQITAH